MRFQKSKLLLLFCFFILLKTGIGQGDFYDLSKIQKIEIQFSQSNWDYILDTNKYGGDNYIPAQFVKINGVQLDSVGVKYKGSSSYDSTFKKNPLHLKLDRFKNNTYQGLTDIKLANGYSDPSMIREVLAYSILNKYMHSSRSNFAMVFINGRYFGLYANDEPIGKTFCSTHFYSDAANPMFKCSQQIASPYAKSSLKFISYDSADYLPRYEIESKVGWADFVALCDTVTNFKSRIAALTDVDRFLWMFAFNNVLINLDSYSGAFSQNFYVFKDNTGHYNPLIWDMNMSFGAFPYVGSQGGGLGTLTVAQMQNLTTMLHSADADWPMMNYLLSDASYKKRYQAHLKTILNENFVNAGYESTTMQLQALIDSAVKADTCKFFSYAQFQTGLNTNVTYGSRIIPGIKNLMDTRKSYLLANELTGTQPTIANISQSNSKPPVGSNVTFTANIQNAVTANLFYRFNDGQKFKSLPLFDDGAHNDGAANDKKYGATINMTSGACQYYLYAESTDAAKLSPERAEHEFYTILSSSSTVKKGEIAINEFMASNIAAVKDSAGDYDDWVELYNNTPNTVDLTGWYLTDDFTNQTKWKFSNGTSIGPNGYLIIWCDNQITQVGVHATFKLSNSGEQLMLSQADSSIIDSVSYSTQKIDTSAARIPNGTGTFQFRLPTFNKRNDTAVVGVSLKLVDTKRVTVYPNPGSGIFAIDGCEIEQVTVFDHQGKLILETSSGLVDLSRFDPGFYLFKVISLDGTSQMKKIELIK